MVAAVIFTAPPIGRLRLGPFVVLMSLVMIASNTQTAEGEHRG